MSNKNPFEIRLEILKMAKELMDREYEDASNRYWTAYKDVMEKYGKNWKEVSEMMEELTPKMYTPQEVMKRASELYGFVSKKD